ncbi:MAG: hypothetical protein ACE5GO_04315 [Anaerolineales bacterium]
MKQKPFWFLFNPYGWLIFILSLVTAFILDIRGFWWMIFLGIIGYQVVLLVELTLGRSLGRTGSVRLARAEQENRELRAEQARLLGAIKERDEKLARLQQARPGHGQEAGQSQEPS